MLGDMARPNDGALLEAAARSLRREAGIGLIFGGLCDSNSIPVVMSQGHRMNVLKTLRIHPQRGLGGRSWTMQRPLLVQDYESSRTITHDYDPQILGESIRSLAVAPIVVRKRVRGLLYAALRGAESIRQSQLARLSEQAFNISTELDVRDEVDRRIGAWRSDTITAPAGGLSSEVRDRLVQIAETTTDLVTRQTLRDLLSPGTAENQRPVLTARQADVLRMVAQGARNDEIARKLSLSLLTVKSYLRDTFRTLGARSRLDAVIRARAAGVLP